MATKQQDLAIEEAKSARVQSRSVLIFTAITIIFLPLSFFTSYFGMNLTDVRETIFDSRYFWSVAGPTSGGIVILIFVIAKWMSVVRELPPDLEKGTVGSADAESEKSWRSRLGLTKGKIKSS